MFDATRLPGFLHKLRTAGYRIDIDGELLIVTLLTYWSASGAFPETSDQLCNALSSLVSKSEKQQAEFRNHFEVWFGTWSSKSVSDQNDGANRADQVSLDPNETTGMADADRGLEQRSERSAGSAVLNGAKPGKRRRWMIGVVVLSLVVLGMIPTYLVLKERTSPFAGSSSPTSAEESAKKEPQTSQNAAEFARQVLDYLRAVVSSPLTSYALAIVILAAGAVALRWRPPLSARFRYYAGIPRATLTFDMQSTRIPEEDRRRARFRVLRSPSLIPSAQLDLARTIERSINQGGLFSPVFATQRVAVEYDILVDRTRGSDHLAQMFTEYVSNIMSVGSVCDLYYFQRDPRQCFGIDGRARSLAELGRRQYVRRMIIMSDGDGLIDPITGTPGAWADEIRAWRQRVIVSPRHPSLWSTREANLAELVPIAVVPAIGDWIEFLAAYFTGQEPPQRTAQAAPREFKNLPALFDLLAERPFRWMDTSAPDPELVERLCLMLSDSLGHPLFDWLSACAVYPALSWIITVHLGNEMIDTGGHPLLTEDRLLILSQLPWFRQGRMPRWLREGLIGAMPQNRYDEVRALFESGLALSGDWNPGDLPLRVVLSELDGVSSSLGNEADATLLQFVHRRRPKGVDLYTSARKFKALLGVQPRMLSSPAGARQERVRGTRRTRSIPAEGIPPHAGLRDRLGNEWMAATEAGSLTEARIIASADWRSALFSIQ